MRGSERTKGARTALIIYPKRIHSSYNPIDPNPAVAAHAVFLQSGHSRPKKRPLFHIFPHFFQNRTLQNVVTAYVSPIYQIKADEMPFLIQQKLFRFDK